MNKTRITIIILIVAIIGSNLWWAYLSLDTGITLTYTRDSYEQEKEALDQTLALLPVVAQSGSHAKR